MPILTKRRKFNFPQLHLTHDSSMTVQTVLMVNFQGRVDFVLIEVKSIPWWSILVLPFIHIYPILVRII